MINRDDFFKGVAIGFLLATIIWSFLWTSFIKKTNDAYEQKIDFLIEKRQKQ